MTSSLQLSCAVRQNIVTLEPLKLLETETLLSESSKKANDLAEKIIPLPSQVGTSSAMSLVSNIEISSDPSTEKMWKLFLLSQKQSTEREDPYILDELFPNDLAKIIVDYIYSGPAEPFLVEDSLKKLLREYKLGENAKRFFNLYSSYPYKITEEDIDVLKAVQKQAQIWGDDSTQTLDGDSQFVEGVKKINYWLTIEKSQYSRSELYSAKIMCAIYKNKTICSSRVENIIKEFIKSLGIQCENFVEISEYLTYLLNEPTSTHKSELDMSTLKLIFDFTIFRIDLINSILSGFEGFNFDFNYLDMSLFNLPQLSFDQTQVVPPKVFKERIINYFRTCFDSSQTVYTLFRNLIYRGGNSIYFDPKSVSFYKSSIFSKWLGENNVDNENAFEDEDMTKYKPKLLIDYLVEKGFLALLTDSSRFPSDLSGSSSSVS